MPKEQPQPFLFEEMKPPPKEAAPESAAKEVVVEKKKEKEDRFKVIENKGFVLVLEVESPIYFQREYLFGKPIRWKSEIGEGDYTNSPAYGWLSEEMDKKARAIFFDETAVNERKRIKRNQKRVKFLDGKFSQN
jgi:hypothetical protein